MITKRITYTDFNDVERTEEFNFHISEAEITELELSTPGGMEAYLKKIIESKDGAKIIDTFKTLIKMSYGVKSEDGKHFRKSQELTDDFVSSAAFPVLFMELATDADKAGEFVNGIIPKSLAEKMATVNTITPLPGKAPVEGIETPKA